MKRHLINKIKRFQPIKLILKGQKYESEGEEYSEEESQEDDE